MLSGGNRWNFISGLSEIKRGYIAHISRGRTLYSFQVEFEGSFSKNDGMVRTPFERRRKTSMDRIK
jgi:hypothetical protein